VNDLLLNNELVNKTSDTALSPHGIAATLSVAPTPFVSLVPKVFVAWASGIPASWVLETVSSANATQWTTITRTPTTVEGQVGVLLDSGTAAQYSRLRSP
jgi:hypothetical protein